MAEAKSVIQVRKNNGELVPFDVIKLKEALRRSGAGEIEIEAVALQVQSSLYEGIKTKKIFELAYSLLGKLSHRSAGRFKLKRALFELGPSGFPFEQFVARIIETEGYSVLTGQIIQGRCVQHEVDVVASKPGKVIMAECKFHQSEGVKSDVKISLYVNSRFIDIKQKFLKKEENRNIAFQPMLVTNTRFTDDAIQFGECSGLRLVSWDYPVGNGLKEWIDRLHFYPITVLMSLNRQERVGLMEKGIVLCKDIVNNPDLLTDLHLPQDRFKNITHEAQALVR
ncbi:MAG: ATP cone domain-containing protein [Bacteroidota bacterium]